MNEDILQSLAVFEAIGLYNLGAVHYLSWGVMEERGGGGEVGDFDCVTLNFS